MWRRVVWQIDTKVTGYYNFYFFKYILLTVHHVMILVKWSTWRTVLFYVFIYIFKSLHLSSTSCSSSGETNFINTTSCSCHSVSVAVSCAGRKWTSDLHTTRPPTQNDSYRSLYWHNLSLLIMSTMCSKQLLIPARVCKLSKTLRPLTCIFEVSGSNTGLNTDSSDPHLLFCSFPLQVTFEILP